MCKKKSGISYVTFDGKHVRLESGKKYTLSRHVSKDGDVDFSVLGTTEDCSVKGRRKICISSITVLFGDHSAEITYDRASAEVNIEKYSKKNQTSSKIFQVVFSIDQTVLSGMPTIKHGIKFDQSTTGNYYLEIESLHIKVDFKLVNSEFVVSVPFALYGKNLQGLCGTT